jgi:hypothetical protein
MAKPFRRNFSKYRIRGDKSRAAKMLNNYMARCMVTGGYGVISHNLGPLNAFRVLRDEEAVPVLLLGYKHFLWLINLPLSTGKKSGDNIYYASGLDFAVQILARKKKLSFTSQQLASLVTAYLTHPGPTPCLPPYIIVGVIAKAAGKLARTGALDATTRRLLHRVATFLRNWDREWDSMPPSLLRRIEKALHTAGSH